MIRNIFLPLRFCGFPKMSMLSSKQNVGRHCDQTVLKLIIKPKIKLSKYHRFLLGIQYLTRRLHCAPLQNQGGKHQIDKHTR